MVTRVPDLTKALDKNGLYDKRVLEILEKTPAVEVISSDALKEQISQYEEQRSKSTISVWIDHELKARLQIHVSLKNRKKLAKKIYIQDVVEKAIRQYLDQNEDQEKLK